METWADLHKKENKTEVERMLLAAVHYVASETKTTPESVYNGAARLAEVEIKTSDPIPSCPHCKKTFKQGDIAFVVEGKQYHEPCYIFVYNVKKNRL